MGTKLIKSESNFSFHLDGQNSIDASLLADIIKNMAKLTEAAIKAEDPEAYIKINVTAFKNGSFQIDFSSICEAAVTLWATMGPAVNVAVDATKTVIQFFKVVKHLKGDQPKSITPTNNGEVIIQSQSGGTLCVSKSGSAIVNNGTIKNLVVKICSDTQKHNPEGGFSLAAEEEAVYYTAEETKAIAESLSGQKKLASGVLVRELIGDSSEASLCKKSRCSARLSIKTPDLLGRAQWGFKYEGKTIKASIDDEEFIEKIHNGQTIQAGDSIDVTLEICVDLDASGYPIDSTVKYTVLSVHGDIIHASNSSQLELDI